MKLNLLHEKTIMKINTKPVHTEGTKVLIFLHLSNKLNSKLPFHADNIRTE